ncbi:metallophosphoesterase [uncultured Proteiniphilum sp.]|uniref:metallophosphoesterase family protein n=1 Tax=uncultured Proteiniphilum sp. TaxID=497637 RepID=UPI002612F640|nr:metallophosphoesterase [uncultured Proteiniphilum sp.]
MMKKIITFVVIAFWVFSLYAQDNFRFIFMADVHYHEKNGAPQALDTAIDTINKLNPDFILVGGDILYDALRRSQGEAEEQCRLFLDKATKLNAPLYYAIGNHDHFAVYNKKIDVDHPLYGKKLYEKYFGPRYYSFDYKGWHFISLDDMMITEDRKYIGRLDSIQLKWLQKDIEQLSDTTPVVIMTHVPLITTLSQWYGGGTNANNNKTAIENSEEILQLFKNKNLRLILQGHIHYYEVLHLLNKTTVISAPSFSGKWWMGKMHGMEEGFVQIDIIDNNNFDYHYIDYKWNVQE